MSTKVVIVGAAGRMGQALVRGLYAGAVEGLELAGAADQPGCPALGMDVGTVAGIGKQGIDLTADLSQVGPAADVVIDFSFHTATAEHARRCAQWRTAMVIGTTGLSEDEQGLVREATRSIAVVMAPNMSLGVNLLFSLARQAAHALRGKDYDVEIIERHHRRKKDAPSGTALRLGEEVAGGLGLDLGEVSVHGRQGLAPGARPPNEIGFHAVRGGDIVGDHTVVFATDGEVLELSHRATSRDAFAVGALRAARWVAGREPGLYGMRDVLGLEA